MTRLRQGCQFVYVFALIAVALHGTAHGREPLRAEPQSLEGAAPELIQGLRADAYTYFRFVNRPWIARVCDDLRSDLEGLPVIRLHGDAHVEQFALANDQWGLDDFDDSVRGPAVIDIVRFLGSVDLASRQRRWEKNRDALFDRFFEGYQRGLTEPDYAPPTPEIVRRLRSAAPPTRAAFLKWGDAKMRPMSDPAMQGVVAAMQAFSRIVLSERADLAPGYFRVARAGWLQGGVGSAVSPKILVRVQGPSDDSADDELLELRKIGDLGGLSCLEIPTFRPTLRIVDGSKQLGRLKYNIMAAGPELAIPEVTSRGQQVRDWWIRSLDPSYRQVRLTELQSLNDLNAIVYDSGVQLGAGRLQDRTVSQSDAERKQTLAATHRLAQRYRQEASTLIDDVLRGWRELRAR